jgi:hypothetical protein
MNVKFEDNKISFKNNNRVINRASTLHPKGLDNNSLRMDALNNNFMSEFDGNNKNKVVNYSSDLSKSIRTTFDLKDETNNRWSRSRPNSITNRNSFTKRNEKISICQEYFLDEISPKMLKADEPEMLNSGFFKQVANSQAKAQTNFMRKENRNKTGKMLSRPNGGGTNDIRSALKKNTVK